MLFSCWAQAGGSDFYTGARSAGLASCSVTLSDPWSAFNNQAGLAGERCVSAGLFYTNRFLVPELGYSSAAGVIPLKKGNVLALSLSRFGYSLFNEKKAGLAFAKKFGDRFSCGIQTNFIRFFIRDESSRSVSTVTIEAGCITQITESFAVGVHLYNPNRSKLIEYNDERIPAALKLGAACFLSDKVKLLLEGEKESGRKQVIRAGMEYEPLNLFFMRTGITSDPGTVSFGFGFSYGKVKCDVAVEWNPVLGYTPSVSLLFQFGNEK